MVCCLIANCLRIIMANKLELTWFGKENDIKPEPRPLIERKDLSYSKESSSIIENPFYDNILIHGDNLIALKSLEHLYAGKIKCVYIDPPYNTGAAFDHYDDNVEHSTYLSLMRPRLISLRNLLSDDGSLWISIDDDEQAYLKILCDEIFGRDNFVASVIWQKKGSRSNDAKWFSDNHDFVMVYAKKKDSWKINKIPRGEGIPKGYSNPDNDPRGPWTSTIMSAKSGSDSLLYEITIPSGRVVLPPVGRYWSCSKETFERWKSEGRIWFGPKGDSAPRKKTFLCDVQDGLVPLTVWLREEVGDNQEAKHEIKALNLSDKPFDTPKPERLIQRIIQLATNEGDYVLDSFLGSGTTAAVAHKMHRHWIGVELGDQAYTYCKPRIDMVINGKENGGITKATGWIDGGGYKFYELAPTLINIDAFGQPVINKEYNSDMLAAAVAIHEGFKYNPDESCYWKQAKNENNTYLYVTTNHVNESIINSIKADMKDDEFLVLVCKSFDEAMKRVSKNITIKKIPQSLLKNCEFGVDNYNLNIVSPPEYDYDEEEL